MDFLRKKELGHLSVDNIKDGLQAPSHIEFPENAVQMVLNRLFADEKGLSDFFICAACG